MTLPAARMGDPTAHGGAVVSGCPTVLIGSRPAARAGDLHACPQVTGVVPHVGGPIAIGAFSVLVANLPQARQTDMATCTGPADAVLVGEATVLVGTGGAGGAGLASAVESARKSRVTGVLGTAPRTGEGPNGEAVTRYGSVVVIEGDAEFQARAVAELRAFEATAQGRVALRTARRRGRTVKITPGSGGVSRAVREPLEALVGREPSVVVSSIEPAVARVTDALPEGVTLDGYIDVQKAALAAALVGFELRGEGARGGAERRLRYGVDPPEGEPCEQHQAYVMTGAYIEVTTLTAPEDDASAEDTLTRAMREPDGREGA